MAAGPSLEVDPARRQAGLEALLGRVAGRFGRVEPRRRARAFVYRLLAALPRKNCWTLAEHAGDVSLMGCSTCWAGRCGTVAVYLVPVAACFVGGLLAIWWAEVIRRGR